MLRIEPLIVACQAASPWPATTGATRMRPPTLEPYGRSGVIAGEREALRRGPRPGRRDRVEPLADPTRAKGRPCGVAAVRGRDGHPVAGRWAGQRGHGPGCERPGGRPTPSCSSVTASPRTSAASRTTSPHSPRLRTSARDRRRRQDHGARRSRPPPAERPRRCVRCRRRHQYGDHDVVVLQDDIPEYVEHELAPFLEEARWFDQTIRDAGGGRSSS